MEIRDLKRILNKLEESTPKTQRLVEQIIDNSEKPKFENTKGVQIIKVDTNIDIQGTPEEWLDKQLNDLKYINRCLITDYTHDQIIATVCNSEEFLKRLIDKFSKQQEIDEFYDHF